MNKNKFKIFAEQEKKTKKTKSKNGKKIRIKKISKKEITRTQKEVPLPNVDVLHEVSLQTLHNSDDFLEKIYNHLGIKDEG